MNTVRIQAPERGWTVQLNDSATARDFLALLPLTLELTDHADTEKVADLPRRLSREGAPASATPRVGDVAYYAPWGNLAIYHKDFHASPGLILLGHIDGTTAGLERLGSVAVTITRVSGDRP